MTARKATRRCDPKSGKLLLRVLLPCLRLGLGSSVARSSTTRRSATAALRCARPSTVGSRTAASVLVAAARRAAPPFVLAPPIPVWPTEPPAPAWRWLPLIPPVPELEQADTADAITQVTAKSANCERGFRHFMLHNDGTRVVLCALEIRAIVAGCCWLVDAACVFIVPLNRC